MASERSIVFFSFLLIACSSTPITNTPPPADPAISNDAGTDAGVDDATDAGQADVATPTNVVSDAGKVEVCANPTGNFSFSYTNPNPYPYPNPCNLNLQNWSELLDGTAGDFLSVFHFSTGNCSPQGYTLSADHCNASVTQVCTNVAWALPDGGVVLANVNETDKATVSLSGDQINGSSTIGVIDPATGNTICSGVYLYQGEN
jgi:hypothetical protein